MVGNAAGGRVYNFPGIGKSAQLISTQIDHTKCNKKQGKIIMGRMKSGSGAAV